MRSSRCAPERPCTGPCKFEMAHCSLPRCLTPRSPRVARAHLSLLPSLLFPPQLHKSGERDVEALREAAMAVLRSEPKLTTEYISLSSCADGAEVTALPPDHAPSEPGTMAAVAVKLGSTRLIDNLLLK